MTRLERLVPKRFRVTFANVMGGRFTYFVCSCLDERKALVIAAEHHGMVRPALTDQIYDVVELSRVEGHGPQEADLCDRAEW